MADVLLVEGEEFDPVQVTEETLEGLLRTEGSELFPGLRYLDFRPPVPSRTGTRHPDGALVAPGCADWWVVEVELHTHDVRAHIQPQLEGLADGIYGWEAFGYLTRHSGVRLEDFENVQVWEPSFLLIIDHLTPQITSVAGNANFDVLECSVYRSRYNRYALAAAGTRPSWWGPSLAVGVDVMLESTHGVSLLRPIGRMLPEALGPVLLIGERQVSLRFTRDGKALALPIAVDEIQAELGVSDRYRLTLDSRLLSIDNTPKSQE